MSDEVEASADGVRVTKSFETEEFPVPTVTFDVVSERDEPVTVRIEDAIPEEFEMDHVGFHPDYGSDNWTAYPDHRVEYERRLEAGESIRTVYGVRVDDPSEGEKFLGDPDVTAEPVGELDESQEGEPVEETTMSDIAPRERTDVVRDVAGGESETVPGMDEPDDDAEEAAAESEPVIEADAGDGEDLLDEEEDLLDEDVDEDPLGLAEHESESADEAVSLGEGDEAATPIEDEPELEAEAGGGAETETESASEDVAAALAAQIRAGEVDEDDLEAIAGAFGGESASRSSEVQLEHLQARVGELEAYADALEAFIDESGTASELLADLEDDVAAIEDRVDDLAADVSAGGEEREAIRSEVSALSEDVEAVADVPDRVDEVEETVEGLSDDVAAVTEDLDRLGGDLDALEERVAGVESDVAELDEIEAEIDELEEDVEDVEDDVEEIREWRDQLTDVFGG